MNKVLSPADKLFRSSKEIRRWTFRCLERDDYECVVCGKETNLSVHHIKTYRNYPMLRTEIDNGITLCWKCHEPLIGKEHLIENLLSDLVKNAINSVKRQVANTEPSRDSDISEGVTTRDRVLKELKQLIDSWKTKEVECVICKEKVIRRYCERKTVNVCSDKCRVKWMKGRLKGSKHPRWKDFKGNKCKYCEKITITPAKRTRIKKFCNNSCQIKWQWKNMRETMKRAVVKNHEEYLKSRQ